MKIFASILSLYILVLTIVPCIDEPLEQNISKIELSQKSTQNHQHISDQCSPFCTCDCCVSPIIYQDFAVKLQSFSFEYKLYSAYQTEYISSLYTSIWQPPRIS